MNAPEPFSPNPISPLNIALLGYRSHPHVGGQGIFLNYLSKALVELGHRVDVISGPPYPELDPRVTLVKLPSLDLYASANPLRELRWRHLASFTDSYEYLSKMTGGFAEPYTFSRRAAAYLKANPGRYHIVHDNQCLGWGLLAMERAGIPVVATIHHPISRDLEIALAAQPSPWLKLMTKRWYRFIRMQMQVARKLRHVVTVSECSRQDIASAFGRPPATIDVIANGVDTELFRPLPEVTKEPLRLITTASSDQPLKGQKFLLQAVAQLRARYPKLQLVVIGTLKEEGETAQLLTELNLQQCVSFKSQLTTEQLVAEFNRAAIAITPSLYEGFGLPAAEAMACGTAVITSDGGALPEVVGDAGLVVPAGDSRALAEAIDKLISNPELARQLAEQGRARILQHFSWHGAAVAFSHYYQQILQGQSDPQCTPSISNALS
ncbi:glycosyltransferase family 4 protein [Halioxenophilus sp. WMMB6]|uniref:glycosyltransferase family 4 protein n=1 Tax=Halioxenophilus sp. WMMB6 TaxID=3073815 RepID=UPI00295F3A6E|nr:glycosyltransferase family 4 protein [Halioxenophilus sp. WMMB6]